jgi:predicted PurR-regulated permease PerM
VFVAVIFYIVWVQVSDLIDDWPAFKQKFNITLTSIKRWVATNFNVGMYKQTKYLNNETSKLVSENSGVIGTTVVSVSSMLFFFVLLILDTFFVLFYRRLIIKFLVALFKEENAVLVFDISANVQSVIRKYIFGLLLEMGIVSAACCIAFWIIGIKYALLLGLITGLFNIVPYIGIFTALVISILVTIGTAAATTKLFLVIVTIVAIHLVDSNVLLPMIVASKVKINALITLLAVVIGEMMWGIPGMFLAVPVVAITKVVFERIDSLKPWGLLLSDEKDEEQPIPDLKAEVIEDAKKGTDPMERVEQPD